MLMLLRKDSRKVCMCSCTESNPTLSSLPYYFHKGDYYCVTSFFITLMAALELDPHNESVKENIRVGFYFINIYLSALSLLIIP